jgi:hypothetical protein
MRVDLLGRFVCNDAALVEYVGLDCLAVVEGKDWDRDVLPHCRSASTQKYLLILHTH